ncbi:MAG TPA: hypothetical protein VK335_02005 [Bryobacteraceae bacterium]|nr:hypothetical protein [Bryobacteraceae bacterium]
MSESAVTVKMLVATVGVDGSMSTSFQQLMLNDLPHANPDVPEPLVRWCYEHNKQEQRVRPVGWRRVGGRGASASAVLCAAPQLLVTSTNLLRQLTRDCKLG